jgi:hypothetical protein
MQEAIRNKLRYLLNMKDGTGLGDQPEKRRFLRHCGGLSAEILTAEVWDVSAQRKYKFCVNAKKKAEKYMGKKNQTDVKIIELQLLG